jgi:hypothetical protein
MDNLFNVVGLAVETGQYMVVGLAVETRGGVLCASATLLLLYVLHWHRTYDTLSTTICRYQLSSCCCIVT